MITAAILAVAPRRTPITLKICTTIFAVLSDYVDFAYCFILNRALNTGYMFCIVKRKPCLHDGTLTAELVRLVENPCIPINGSPNDGIEDISKQPMTYMGNFQV